MTIASDFTVSPATDYGKQLICQKGGAVNIYVGNLSLEITEDELFQWFTAFGEVTSVTIMDDRYIGSGQTRSYGYVEMTSKTEGKAAIDSLEGKKLGNRVVNVVEALPLSNKGATGISESKRVRSNRKRERKYQMI